MFRDSGFEHRHTISQQLITRFARNTASIKANHRRTVLSATGGKGSVREKIDLLAKTDLALPARAAPR